jgi:hypothetical protein
MKKACTNSQTKSKTFSVPKPQIEKLSQNPQIFAFRNVETEKLIETPNSANFWAKNLSLSQFHIYWAKFSQLIFQNLLKPYFQTSHNIVCILHFVIDA